MKIKAVKPVENYILEITTEDDPNNYKRLLYC